MLMGRALALFLLCSAALLSACVPRSHYDEQVEKTTIYQQVDAQLKGELTADRLKIEQLQKLVRLTLYDGLLFPEGGWELDEAGKKILTRLAPALKDLNGQRIVVKGFTDNLPIGPELRARFPNNVELSKARAAVVAKDLVAAGVPSSMVYASGLGQTHPVASNDTPQGQARNRRVEIDIVEAPQ